jgi:hypothetical protein
MGTEGRRMIGVPKKVDPLLVKVFEMQKQSYQKRILEKEGFMPKLNDREASLLIAIKCIKNWDELKIPLSTAQNLIINGSKRNRREV